MKIKLSKEQVSEIANEVVSAISRPRMDSAPRTVARIRLPVNKVVQPRLDTRRDDGNLRCWTYTVATHEALRIIGRRRTDVVSLDDDEGEALAGRIADEAIDDAAEGDAILLRLQQAIHRLPTKQQLVFNLRYYSEMSYDEIAQVTGIPATSAKASFHVAKQKITEYMTAHEAR